jgi:hypothetical protein
LHFFKTIFLFTYEIFVGAAEGGAYGRELGSKVEDLDTSSDEDRDDGEASEGSPQGGETDGTHNGNL